MNKFYIFTDKYVRGDYMQYIIDLHTHTSISDGSMSPIELVRYAKEKGLSAIAITDHDSIDGIRDAIEEGEALGVEVVAGIEISVDFDTEMHILGYFFGNSYEKVNNQLAHLINSREERNIKIIEKLRQLGMNICMEDIQQKTCGKVVGRVHIAKALEKKGYVKNIKDAFDRYLAYGKAAYISKNQITPKEGIQLIRNANGIPVLAHPGTLKLSFSALDKTLTELTSYGLLGIEAHYVDNTQSDTMNFLRLAIKHNLLVTGGSDFHGDHKPKIDLGKGYGNLFLSYDLLKNMKMLIKTKEKVLC